MSEPTEDGLGPADDRDVEQAENYRRQREVDEAMAVYSTDEELTRDHSGNAAEEERYGGGDAPDEQFRRSLDRDRPDNGDRA